MRLPSFLFSGKRRSVAFEGEGVLLPLDEGALLCPEVDFDDVETDGNAAPEQLEPVVRAYAQKAPLGVVYGARRRTGCGGDGAFHLADDERIPLSRYEIKLAAAPPAEPAAQYTQAPSTQVRLCHQLCVISPVLRIGYGIRTPGAAQPVQQVQTSGDGVA